MKAAEEDEAAAVIPWQWILEHLVDMRDIGTPILREMMTYLPNTAFYKSLQKRVAVRYLEEAIAEHKIDAQVIPLLVVLSKESERMSNFPTSSDYNALLLRVQIEAVLMHIRGKPRDWQLFTQALDRIFPEDTMDARLLEKREELSPLLQAGDQERRRVELLESYPLCALRQDLLKCITSEKSRAERTFLDKLLQDVFDGKYPLAVQSTGKPVSEKEDSQEDFHSADGQRNSIGSDEQTVIGGRNSNANSEEAIEINNKDSASTRMAKDGSPPGIHERSFSQTLSQGNGSKKCNHGPKQMSVCLRERDEHGKAVTSFSPIKNTRESNLRPTSIEETALDFEEDSLRVEFLEVGTDGHEELCHKCKEGGRLICCDGCPIAVHRRCLGVDINSVTEEWFCPLCIQKRAAKALAQAKMEALAARERAAQFMNGGYGKKADEKQARSPVFQRMSEQNHVADTKKIQETEAHSPTVSQAQDGVKICVEKPTMRSDAQNTGLENPVMSPGHKTFNRALVDPYEGFLNNTRSSCLPFSSLPGVPSHEGHPYH